MAGSILYPAITWTPPADDPADPGRQFPATYSNPQHDPTPHRRFHPGLQQVVTGLDSSTFAGGGGGDAVPVCWAQYRRRRT